MNEEVVNLYKYNAFSAFINFSVAVNSQKNSSEKRNPGARRDQVTYSESL
jgi:hypothetical protein